MQRPFIFLLCFFPLLFWTPLHFPFIFSFFFCPQVSDLCSVDFSPKQRAICKHDFAVLLLVRPQPMYCQRQCGTAELCRNNKKKPAFFSGWILFLTYQGIRHISTNAIRWWVNNHEAKATYLTLTIIKSILESLFLFSDCETTMGKWEDLFFKIPRWQQNCNGSLELPVVR